MKWKIMMDGMENDYDGVMEWNEIEQCMDGMENGDDKVTGGQMKWKNEMDGMENDDDEVTDG